MVKNIIILVLAAVILGTGGYLIGKNSESAEEKQRRIQRKEYEKRAGYLPGETRKEWWARQKKESKERSRKREEKYKRKGEVYKEKKDKEMKKWREDNSHWLNQQY